MKLCPLVHAATGFCKQYRRLFGLGDEDFNPLAVGSVFFIAVNPAGITATKSATASQEGKPLVRATTDAVYRTDGCKHKRVNIKMTMVSINSKTKVFESWTLHDG